MKKLLYKLLSDSGYRIVNKRKENILKKQHLSKYKIVENEKLLLNVYKYIKNFEFAYGKIAIKNEGRGFLFSFDGITVYLETFNEFYILNEIFFSKCYDFNLSDDLVVIDIGANIGLASLFFSKKNQVKKIYAFEPVTFTFKQAQRNIALNPFNKVVELHNFGLGDKDETATFLFNEHLKGNTGIVNTLSGANATSSELSIDVNIKKASPIVQDIISLNKSCNILLKIDCEGAEYEIFKDFESTGVLNHVDYIMMEWHHKGSASLEKILKQFKFNYFLKVSGTGAGMIYAFKVKN